MTYLAVLLLAAAPVPKDPPDKPTAAQVAELLAKRHPVVRTRPAGQFVFAPDTKVVELKTPAVTRAEPGLRLFRTTLDTGHYEYREVETLVAAWTEKGMVVAVECRSPTYDDSSAALAERLRGLRGKTAEERKELAAEVCEAFAGITYQGQIKAGQLKGDTYSAELWHNDRLWRRIQLSFDANGALKELELVNPNDAKK